MATTLKICVTSKTKLSAKYGSQFAALKKLFAKLVDADKKNMMTTKIVYLDDTASCKAVKLKAVSSVNEKSCKDFIDKLYKVHKPPYIVIFGAQDIIPFQQLKNDLYKPGNDDDAVIPSDLPYACESAYSRKVSAFVNPVRVVGRIPDIPGIGDMAFVTTIIDNIVEHKSRQKKDYQSYFAVSADVWKDSTRESITNIFGNTTQLLYCPPSKGGYTKTQLKPLSHFYNCHGASDDPNYYGQKGEKYPVALNANDVKGKISKGTVIAAECCYGAQLLNPGTALGSISSNYLLNNASSFLGSSTIAYGPSSGQGLADLICQYFMINVHEGASTGRALLEARQKFLNVSGPHLDPYELKTLAQFYILGDPSLSLVSTEQPKIAAMTIQNTRQNLYSKGIVLGESMAPSIKIETHVKRKHTREVIDILRNTGFRTDLKEKVFETRFKKKQRGEMAKSMTNAKTRYRTFEKSSNSPLGIRNIKVLVVKENDAQVLGYRVYVSR
ncbi:MAG: C25 family cysteine peptidase [Chryseolinea sp.]